MFGIFSILFAILGELHLAVFAIYAGAIFDFLDGFAARLMKTSGELGKQLDSLADMVTFGVAPGVMMMVVLTLKPSNLNDVSTGLVYFEFTQWFSLLSQGKLILLPLFGLIIPFFSMFRLAKFNIDTRQTTSFIGLPTPANTLFFTTFPLAIVYTDVWASPVSEFLFNPYLIVTLIILMGLLMVSEIPLFSLKMKNFKWKGNEIRFVFLLISLVLIFIFRVWSIALIVILYLIMSFVENTFVKK
tara:strand:+ start:60311 stop:61042 length:732 start_codon:yes stop_codon:yes gene_type:complete